MPLTNSTAPRSPYRSMAWATGPSSARLPTTTRWASGCSVRSLASASTRWTRPLSGTSALDVVTIRPGTSATDGSGDQRPVSAPMCTTRTRSAHPEVLDDLLLRGAGDGEHGGQPAGDALLHAREAVPAAHGGALAAARRGGEVELPVDGDGVVDGGDQGCAEVAEQAVAERLVVVDDVEVAAAGRQVAPGAEREGEGLGEAAGPHRRHFEGVDPVAVLVAPGGAEGVGAAVQVEAGQLGERYALVEYGQGWEPRTSTLWPSRASSRERWRT